MKILVLNCGSSSIKYQLIDMPAHKKLAKGLVERIGEPEGFIKHTTEKGQKTLSTPFKDHAEGLKKVIDFLTDNDPINDLSEIAVVGHRVVHGGEKLTHTVHVTDDVIRQIAEAEPIDPLHVPAHILGIKVVQQLMPNIPQVTVFDTAFHQTMPEHAYLYALPYELYTEDKIRKYGFHGTSHQYVATRLAEILQKPLDSLNIITCHLGNGSSITAIKNGKSIDTSMGLTPLEGLIMGTRCGDIDPAVLTYLGKTKNWGPDELDNLINKKSGLLGLSKISNDCRIIEEEVEKNNPAAIRAMNAFCYRIKKYIGSYMAVLGHIDAIVFTAGIGENSPYVRWHVCQGLENFGIIIDKDKNEVYGKETRISTENAPVQVWLIPTDEEMAIATQTFELISKN